MQLSKAKLSTYLKSEAEEYDAVVPIIERGLGDREKVALLKKAMDNNMNTYIMNSTTVIPADALLKGKVIRMEKMVYLLRNILLTPQDRPQMKT